MCVCVCMYVSRLLGITCNLLPDNAIYMHTSYLIRCQKTYVAGEVLWVKDTNGMPGFSHQFITLRMEPCMEEL